MKTIMLLFMLALATGLSAQAPRRIFDVHLHGTADPSGQLRTLQKAGVYKAAVSTSWSLQGMYQDTAGMRLLHGLMFPCPNGKVPYSLQPCFGDGRDWPSLAWVEEEIKKGNIHFLGEVLSQYYGISSSDSLLLPYYALAAKYRLPVGIHTGGAGPDHGSPRFKMELGNPAYAAHLLSRFPRLKVWLMHGGDQFYKEAITLMKQHRQVYTDISVLSNPDIIPGERFAAIMKAFITAGLEDRLMFGTDNGDVQKAVAAVKALQFLSARQKNKIFYRNAERFFATQQTAD